jgi:glycosyltransferase involved in cell wall biosynthesis
MLPQVFLFQHAAYLGGVWQATESLVRELVAINLDRKELTLALGVDQMQPGIELLSESCPSLRIERMKTRRIQGVFLRLQYGRLASHLKLFQKYAFFSPGQLALESDLWLALLDRFRRPLAPMRPYGVLIHDMIQHHSPESFSPLFIEKDVPLGLVPTVRGSQFQITTTAATAADVQSYYLTPADRMHMIPVAHEPARRFSSIASETVVDSDFPFFLNIANASPHKGALVLLQGFAQWKRLHPDSHTRLLMCGAETEAFSGRFPTHERDYCNQVRQLVVELGLREGRDVAFLGHVTDGQLKGLFERASLVINAANNDNGSYSMIESVWFGRPLVCSDYPAARYVDARFGLGSHWFKNGSAESLCQTLSQTAGIPPTSQDALAKIRSRLGQKELSLGVFAERFYEALLQEVSRANQNRARVA